MVPFIVAFLLGGLALLLSRIIPTLFVDTIAANDNFYWLIGILLFFYLFLIITRLAADFSWFSQELRQLNREIQLAVGAERKNLIRQRRRLWLSLLPFVPY